MTRFSYHSQVPSFASKLTVLQLILLLSLTATPSIAASLTPILVKSVDPIGNSKLRDFTVVGSKFFFVVNDVTAKRNELWISDGTTVGTRLVKNIDPTGNLELLPFGVADSKFFFVVSDEKVKGNELGITYKLWVSDGTDSGTQILQSFRPPKSSTWFSGITIVGSKLYFFVTDSTLINGETTHGTQLWTSDGTTPGTKMVKNINPTNSSCCVDGEEGAGNYFFIALGSKFLFTTTEGTPGNVLWSSDGSEAGTRVIAVVNPNVWKSLNYGAQMVGSKIYFDAFNGKGSGQLWATNGTATGTKMVKEINPKGDAYFGNFNAIASKLYFTATDGVHGNELWISNGTAAGTRMVKDINLKGNSNVRTSGTLGSKLYFTATDGTHGNELWISNGTAAGTRMVKDINPKGSSEIEEIKVVGKKLYFTADDGIHGFELWVSDGTTKGTYMLKDINPKGDSIILDVTATNQAVYFNATTKSNSAPVKLWSTDGTTVGTQPTKLMTVGGTNLFRLSGGIVLKSIFYLSFNDGTHGNGIWKIA